VHGGFRSARELLLLLTLATAIISSVGCKTTTFFSRKEPQPAPIKSVADALTAVRTNSDPAVRRDAYQFLGNPKRYSGDDSSSDEITEILRLALTAETDPQLRIAVLSALAKLHSPKAIAAIAGATKDKETAVRVTACRLLGQSGARNAADQLDELLISDSSLDVRLAAAEALGNLPSRKAALALLEGVDDPDVAIRFRCRESLKKLTGTDHAADLTDWRKEIQTANFEEPTRRTRPWSVVGAGLHRF
jgi:HEAT repeat protein